MKIFKRFEVFCLLLVLIIQARLSGQVDISAIPDTVLSNTSAVVLDHQETLEIINKSLLKRIVASTTLITKENGTSGYVIYIPYDKYSKIDDIEITILSVDGKKRKTIKKKDMVDQSMVNNVTLATDVRLLIYTVFEKEIPALIKLQYSKTIKESFTIESYVPVTNENTAILSSNFTVINYDSTNQLRFSINPWEKPSFEVTNTLRKYSFQLKNVTTSHLKMLEAKNISTYITPILEDFQMDGIDGNLSSWRNFGLWLTKLGEGTDVLDEKSKAEIKSIIRDTKDKKVIVENLYKYLQKNMRYVSIQLGIGGFKPMPAQDVHNYKYGDCKALSNYMKAILKVAGIPANYIIISAGEDYRKPKIDFPQNVFNHAIVAVPLEQDTIFLECTSQHSPVGYLGSFTGDRKAFWIDGENSNLVNTKSYSYNANVIENIFDIAITPDKSILIGFKQNLSGLGIEHHGYLFTSMFTNEKFKELLEKELPEINNLEILKRSYSDDQYLFECKLASPKNVMKSGARYFVKLKIDELPTSILDHSDHFSIKNGYTIMDKYQINIPVGCHVEKEPKTNKTETTYIDINIETIRNHEQIIVQRKLHLKPMESSEENKAQIEEAKILLKKAMGETVVINCKS